MSTQLTGDVVYEAVVDAYVSKKGVSKGQVLDVLASDEMARKLTDAIVAIITKSAEVENLNWVADRMADEGEDDLAAKLRALAAASA
jgi:hypothetical protein